MLPTAHMSRYSSHSTAPTPTPTRTSSRGSSPTRPTRAISCSYSRGKLNDTPTFSRDDPRQDVGEDVGVRVRVCVRVGVVECQLISASAECFFLFYAVV